MAESAVKATTDLLGNILVEEGKYLWGAEGKVEELRDELLWMQSFLREAETIQYKDETVRMWVSQIKEHVYEAEDIIEDFVIKVVSRRRPIGLLNKLKRYSCIFRELYDLHCAASSIDSLKVKIATLSPKLEKYGLKRSLGINTDKAQEALIEQVQQSLKYAHIEDKKIVGLEKNAQEIITHLKSCKTPNKGFHAIYGMGGLGKTTLATKVVQNDGIKQHFNGGQAFAYISKQFQVESVLQDILKSLKVDSSENLSKSELVSKLHEILKNKKCLVVLDDVWTEQAWDSLKSAFTSCGGDSGSAILLTTRKEEVAKYVDSMALHKPDPLNKEESWELLQKTMGWDTNETSTNKRHRKAQTEIIESNHVSEKIKLGKKMVKVCKGLPLAIVVLGGILRKKQTLGEWHSVHNNIASYLRMGYDHGRSCMEILLQSYNDLPYHLKPCFLHLANFPEDYEIRTENLYWMWIAEGLVTRSCDRTTDTKSLEEVANDYLSDLAQVGLVEIVDKTSEGWIESIRMHDLVRDVCLEKATAESLTETIDLRQCPDKQLNIPYHYSRKRFLRMAIYFSAKNKNSFNLDSPSSKAHKYIRSLLLIGEYGGGDDGQGWMTCICNEFQLLRVLVLIDTNLSRLTSQVENLTHLRYLSLAGTNVSELPSSIGNLRFLEILDLRVFEVMIIPNTLWKLFRLRHLLLPKGGYEIKRSGRMRVDTLLCLERMENLLLKNLQVEGLLKLRSLRELSIADVVSEEAVLDIILKSPALKSAGILGSCKLHVEGDVISKKPSSPSDIVCKLELEITGRVSAEVMKNVESCRYLKSIRLNGCQLEDDPMTIFGSLCHLTELVLSRGSYVGRMISCPSKSFPLLMYLQIMELENLEIWELEHGSMPKLEFLQISTCKKLNRFPDVLPLSLKVVSMDTCYKDQRRHVDSLDSGVQIVDPYDIGEWFEHSVLRSEYDKVVLSGDGDSVLESATEFYRNENAQRSEYDKVVRTWLPRRCSAGRLPRRILQKLLRGLNPKLSRDGRSQFMSCNNLIAEIQKVMQAKKCLVILTNLEDVDHLQDLDKTFGRPAGFERGSKLFIISYKEPPAADCHGKLLALKFRPPTNFETWEMLDSEWEYSTLFYGNAGISWNMLRRCSGHPLSSKMLLGLLKMKENITEWAANHNQELNDSIPLEFSQIFELCYDGLPLHLRPCLIYLANFPEDVEISTKKLYQMWIAAGFVRSKHDDVQTTEYLENLASTYLTELVQRGMVTVVKMEHTERAKTCQLKFALRDLCLKKATEEHILVIVDQLENTASSSNAVLKTQQLAVHLDQTSHISASLDEKLSSLNFISSPTSLVTFSDISDPLYNEDKWKWLLYICKHFQLLRVLDLERMWMTKGRLPKEVGNLGQLRYLSLRGTWVTQLPPSIENLRHLQTLDLRVLESIFIPDVLCELNSLMHLYLPDLIAQETPNLRLCGLKCLQTLVNLHTDKVDLSHLSELKLLRKISIKKIHAVDELDNMFKSLDLEVSINSEIINANPTILSSFQNLHKLKIKGMLLVELHPEMFPTHLEELTLKHTILEEDPLPVLEKLPKLRTLFLGHESFIGKTMTFSKDFCERTNFILCSLNNLEELYSPENQIPPWYKFDKFVIIDCWRIHTLDEDEEEEEEQINLPSDEEEEQINLPRDEEEQVNTHPRCFDLSPLKKGFQSFTCW